MKTQEEIEQLAFKSYGDTLLKGSFIYGNDEPDTNVMNLRFEDNFTTFNTDAWRVGQPWGVYHPKQLYEFESLRRYKKIKKDLVD